jgi:hypothetical protein
LFSILGPKAMGVPSGAWMVIACPSWKVPVMASSNHMFFRSRDRMTCAVIM